MIKSNYSPIVKAKEAAGIAAAKLIQPGMSVGLGSGSTAAFFIKALGERCKEGLDIQAVATSEQSKLLAESLGIPLLNPKTILSLDITVDGADEIDHQFNMIKGGGGALLREKIIAQSSIEWICVIDETKLVRELGSFPIPVEISPFAYKTTIYRLEQKGYRGQQRMQEKIKPFVTDNGNFIFDITFTHPILNIAAEDAQLKHVAGVLETGLFYGNVSRCIIGKKDGSVQVMVR
jgi:ribose 5-phosphate isomerase A